MRLRMMSQLEMLIVWNCNAPVLRNLMDTAMVSCQQLSRFVACETST